MAFPNWTTFYKGFFLHDLRPWFGIPTTDRRASQSMVSDDESNDGAKLLTSSNDKIDRSTNQERWALFQLTTPSPIPLIVGIAWSAWSPQYILGIAQSNPLDNTDVAVGSTVFFHLLIYLVAGMQTMEGLINGCSWLHRTWHNSEPMPRSIAKCVLATAVFLMTWYLCNYTGLILYYAALESGKVTNENAIAIGVISPVWFLNTMMNYFYSWSRSLYWWSCRKQLSKQKEYVEALNTLQTLFDHLKRGGTLKPTTSSADELRELSALFSDFDPANHTTETTFKHTLMDRLTEWHKEHASEYLSKASAGQDYRTYARKWFVRVLDILLRFLYFFAYEPQMMGIIRGAQDPSDTFLRILFDTGASKKSFANVIGPLAMLTIIASFGDVGALFAVAFGGCIADLFTRASWAWYVKQYLPMFFALPFGFAYSVLFGLFESGMEGLAEFELEGLALWTYRLLDAFNSSPELKTSLFPASIVNSCSFAFVLFTGIHTAMKLGLFGKRFKSDDSHVYVLEKLITYLKEDVQKGTDYLATSKQTAGEGVVVKEAGQTVKIRITNDKTLHAHLALLIARTPTTTNKSDSSNEPEGMSSDV